MIAGAYQALALNGTVSINTQAQELTPYMNYVSTYSGTVDSVQTGGSVSCAGKLCLKLHGGGVLYTAYNAGTDAFCGTANNNAIAFSYDPEAGYSGSSSEGKTLTIWLGYKGRIQTYADISAGTCYGTPPSCSLSCANPNSTWQPNWFSWN